MGTVLNVVGSPHGDALRSAVLKRHMLFLYAVVICCYHMQLVVVST